ncbi:hypothetical protein LSTR_LSTR016125, partial [Laodelphax striatellus]
RSSIMSLFTGKDSVIAYIILMIVAPGKAITVGWISNSASLAVHAMQTWHFFILLQGIKGAHSGLDFKSARLAVNAMTTWAGKLTQVDVVPGN